MRSPSMRARTSTVSIGRRSPVSGTLSSMAARCAVATSSDARETEGRPAPPGPPGPPPPLGPCAACAWSSLSLPQAAVAAMAAMERRRANDLWCIGCSLRRYGGAARTRDGTHQSAGQLGGGEVQIDGALCLIRLGDEQL